MYMRLGQAELLNCVAGIAELVAGFFQDVLRHQSMPDVTFLALFLFHYSMNALHRKVFFSKLRMAVQAFLAGKFPLGQRSAKRSREDCYYAQEQCRPCQPSPVFSN